MNRSQRIIINLNYLKKSLFVAFFAFVVNLASLYSQSTFRNINFDLIPYPTVCEYIHKEVERNVIRFSDIKPSWKAFQNEKEYSVQKKTYHVKDSVAHVWSTYSTTSPAESWNGKRVMFGLCVSKNLDKPIYTGDSFDKIEPGQVIFLNLKLLKFYNLAMAFEVIVVDPEKRIIEFSYIEGNKSQGKQCLQFVNDKKGNTKIIHSSYFKSDSKMRDKFLYPYFHTRTTNEFHRIMKRIIKNS